MTIPRIALGGSVAAETVYLTYLLTVGGYRVPAWAALSPVRNAILVLLTAAVLLSAMAVMRESIRNELREIRRDIADYGDRREILGHEIASRAYTSQRNGHHGLRAVDS